MERERQKYHEIFEEKSGKILLATGLAFSMAACGITDNKEKQMRNLVNNKTITIVNQTTLMAIITVTAILIILMVIITAIAIQTTLMVKITVTAIQTTLMAIIMAIAIQTILMVIVT